MQRSVDAMRSEGLPYEGIMYAGFMLTQDGPFLLEFNCRYTLKSYIILVVVF